MDENVDTNNVTDINELEKNQVINALNTYIQNNEKLNISVIGNEESRTLTINQVSFKPSSIEFFDNNMLPAIYDTFYNGKNPEIITDANDLKDGRFMATSANGDSMVVLDLPTNTLENINNHALEVTRTMPTISNEMVNEPIKTDTNVKQKVKTMNIDNMGFVGSMSIGMIIGAIIVIFILILMLVGLIKV